MYSGWIDHNTGEGQTSVLMSQEADIFINGSFIQLNFTNNMGESDYIRFRSSDMEKFLLEKERTSIRIEHDRCLTKTKKVGSDIVTTSFEVFTKSS